MRARTRQRVVGVQRESVVEQQDYYGAGIREIDLGPRRELILHIETWPQGKSQFGGGPLVAIRFGAIANFGEVEAFFTTTPSDGLHFLRESIESRPKRRVFELEFDRSGAQLRIISGNVTIQQDGKTTPHQRQR